MSEKLKTSGVFNLDFELKVQFKTCFCHFSKVFSFISRVSLNILGKVIKSAYLTLILSILLSEVVKL